MVSSKSDIGFLALKDGSNILFKVYNNKVSKSLNLKFVRIFNTTNTNYSFLETIGNTMFNVREIHCSNEVTVLACLVRRENSSQSGGNFAIFEIHGEKNIIISIQNESFKTESFEVINYEDELTDQKFIFVGVQVDGFLWMKSYELKKLSSRHPKEEQLSEDKIEFYNRSLMQSGFLRYHVGEYRATDFKEHIKLPFADINTTNVYKEIEVKFKANAFVTGISLRVEQLGNIKFRIGDSVFEFNVRKPRELQLPLTAK